MLNTYLTETQRLLQLPQAPNSLYSSTDLASYINTARGQLAGDGECIRVLGTLALVQGQSAYDFSAINLGTAAGIQGVLNVRMAQIQVGDGQLLMRPRPFEWFNTFLLNNPVPIQGRPRVWCQYGQASTGSLLVYPAPDTDYTLVLDTVCYPIPLEDDTTVEAIPYPFTDAVPFFAAYYALLSAQTQARQADADRMLARYTEFKNRARRYSNPSTMPFIYPQSGDPTLGNKLGQNSGGEAA